MDHRDERLWQQAPNSKSYKLDQKLRIHFYFFNTNYKIILVIRPILLIPQSK